MLAVDTSDNINSFMTKLSAISFISNDGTYFRSQLVNIIASFIYHPTHLYIIKTQTITNRILHVYFTFMEGKYIIGTQYEESS